MSLIIIVAVGVFFVYSKLDYVNTLGGLILADAMLGLLRDARKTAIDLNADVTVRLDPRTLDYGVDTSGVSGSGLYASGVLDLGAAQSLVTDQPRLQYVFRPSGATFADTVVVRGGQVPLVVRVDPWSGVARADSQ